MKSANTTSYSSFCVFATIAAFYLSSCSFLTWKNSSLSLERGWSSSGKEVVQLETLYQEKDSWNPLMGTTLKRNYHSMIRIFDPIQSSQPVNQIPFSSWILPGTVYYHSDTKSVYWIGGKDDEYGSYSRIPSGIDLSNKKELTLSSYLAPGQVAIQLIPSPDGNSLALVVAVLDNDLEFLKPELVWLSKNGDSEFKPTSKTNLPEWKETPVHKIRWSSKSDKIYIQVSESVFFLTNGKDRFEKASEFPVCFTPSTSFGPVGISPSDESPSPMEKNPRRSFSDSPKTTNVRQIRDCSGQ
ncbi:hypothetical protein EHQ76_09390 [Leptospira barantonii]|uniref:Uncharacterized protein n=1 Tax=Leptospira barantonii TaxID=2023184 RepID=A0A5F2BCZ4_9LEPT|nr:hypothetical protein [Leptospira barantonii]TGM03421.1 hypothetical protein EHQ76_09390 [Leptospira barantonii]